MSDIPRSLEDPSAAFSAYMVWQEAADGLIAQNKSRLLACLAAAAITRVSVRFDGGGDSGQIQEMAAYRGEEEVPLEGGKVELLDLPYGASEPVARLHDIAEAVETLCYGLLRAKHDGWENSDGAFGDFEFLVAEASITLDFNERYTTSENHSYSW